MSFTFEFRKEHLDAMLHGNPYLDHWHNALCEILPEYEINTPQRVAAFLAQCAHESGGFKFLKENLNYRAASLRKVFPKYFPDDAIAARYANKPEMIANRVYGNRMGNGDEASGDGFRYCGRGLIQLTGKENYTNFGNSIGKSADQVIEYLKTLEGALESACWYWNSRKINAACDANDITKMTKLVNGGTIGLADRKKHYDHNLTVLVGTTNVVSIKKTTTSSLDLTTVLNVGSTGDTVKALQTKLGLNPEGTYELRTKRAVKDWQAKNGITADGVAGPVTLKKLLG